MNAASGGSRYDNQESFLFAEVMKYSYLAHSDGEFAYSALLRYLVLIKTEAAWQVQKGDQNTFVFNTEAHPVRVHHT